MFSSGAVSKGDHQRIRISLRRFSSDPVSLSPSPQVCRSLFSEASATTPNSSIKGHEDSERFKPQDLSRCLSNSNTSDHITKAAILGP